MKKLLVILILISLFLACKKEESGTMYFKMKYTTQTLPTKSKLSADTLYTGFGDYITSLTPTRFLGKFSMTGFQDTYNNMDNNTKMLLFIDGNQPANDPARFADFSNNAEVSFSPNLRGIQDDHGLFSSEQINFIYFFFGVEYFYQEVELPQQYANVNLSMFNGSFCNHQYWSDSVKVNNILKIEHFPLICRIFNVTNGWPCSYVFGNCDSTFIFNTEANNVQNSVNWPFGGSTILQIIRSNKYKTVTINTPGPGETVEMISTLGFDIQNLIQVYAGADNIPYNSDDIFIYAPNYWERIRVNLEIKEVQ